MKTLPVQLRIAENIEYSNEFEQLIDEIERQLPPHEKFSDETFNYHQKDHGPTLDTRNSSMHDGALFLTEALLERFEHDVELNKLAQQTKALLTRLKQQVENNQDNKVSVFTSTDVVNQRKKLLQPSTLSIAMALQPLLQHPKVGVISSKLSFGQIIQKLYREIDLAEAFYLATQPRPAVISISKAPSRGKLNTPTLIAQMDVPIDIFDEARTTAYARGIEKLPEEIQAIKALNIADINLTAPPKIPVAKSGFFAGIAKIFNFLKQLFKPNSVTMGILPETTWFQQLSPLHQLLTKKVVDNGDIYTLSSRLDLTLPIPRNYAKHTIITSNSKGIKTAHHHRCSHVGSRAGEAESITPEEALKSAIARTEEVALIQAHEAAKRAYAAGKIPSGEGNDNVIIIENELLLLQSLITPIPGREPDFTLSQHKTLAIQALQQKYEEQGILVTINDKNYFVKFKVFDTNYCQNIGRIIDFTKNGKYAQQAKALCRFIKETTLPDRFIAERDRLQDLWVQDRSNHNLFKQVCGFNEALELLHCTSYKAFRKKLAACKYIAADVQITLDALYQQEALLNATYTSIVTSYNLNREMHLAGLEIFLVRRLGSLPVSFCFSGKDREQLCTNYADAIEIYCNITGKLPRFDDNVDENNDLFAEIQALLFLSQHGAIVAATNALGSEGIKTPYMYLPKNVQNKIIQMSGNPDILKLSEQLASNNDIHKLLTAEFASNIMVHLLNARLKNAEILSVLRDEARAANAGKPSKPAAVASPVHADVIADEAGGNIQNNNISALLADVIEAQPFVESEIIDAGDNPAVVQANIPVAEAMPIPAFAVSSRLKDSLQEFKQAIIDAIHDKQRLAKEKGMPLLSKRGGKVINVEGKMFILPAQLADILMFVTESLQQLEENEKDSLWLANALAKANVLMQETQKKSIEESSFRTEDTKNLYATVLVDGLLDLNVHLYDALERVEQLIKPQPHKPINLSNCAFVAKQAFVMHQQAQRNGIDSGVEEAESCYSNAAASYI